MPRPSHSFSITAGSLEGAFDAACARVESLQFAEALWSRRLSVWSADPATQQVVAHRLGWLQAIDFVMEHLDRLRRFASSVRDEFSDVVLLGMGGSSLAPEVLRQVFGSAPGSPRFHVLDSIDPDSVRRAMARAASTLFVLASKSGSTIEPNVMAAEARRRVLAEGHLNWGSRFVAITDEDTALHRRALAERFRDVFINPSDIGGRYSALSFFGMVPAALMGIDIERVLAIARLMEADCRLPRPKDNPGLALGAFMGAGAREGRDKLTLRLPTPLRSLGLWIEQLVAESTGKGGTGVLPVTGEDSGARWGDDRVVAEISLGDDTPAPGDQAAGDVPRMRIRMSDREALGAEFLRWEVATATAGLLLGVNPFDEPNVQQAKDATRRLLDGYGKQGQLHLPEPHSIIGGARLTPSEPALAELTGRPVQCFLALLKPDDYLALLAYVPSDDPVWERSLESARTIMATRTGRVTTLGYGPRYLHSTGQLHKGGPSSGVFIVFSAEPDQDLEIPGEPYSFGVLETAQAVGDFASLERTGRRALLVRLPRDAGLLRHVCDTLLDGAFGARSGRQPGTGDL